MFTGQDLTLYDHCGVLYYCTSEGQDMMYRFFLNIYDHIYP
jgi:hypothetical protein